jgi:hypothetical protein
MKEVSKSGQFNFTWLFAILAGGAILVLAIFGAMRSGETSQYQSNVEIAKTLDVITNPLQAGYAEAKYSKIEFASETRLRNTCFAGEFGENKLLVTSKNEMNDEWQNRGGEVSIENKYIFSENENVAKTYYVFSKPFYFPYKVADVIFLISKEYCFKNTPQELSFELENLDIPNIKLKDCSNQSEIVCFGRTSSDCDIVVYPECNENICNTNNYDRGTVQKDSGQIKYVGNLLFAAIFSSEENYDCNIERLTYRARKIGKGYSGKIDLMNARGCSSGAKPRLTSWILNLNSTNPDNINSASKYDLMKSLEEEGQRGCELW